MEANSLHTIYLHYIWTQDNWEIFCQIFRAAAFGNMELLNSKQLFMHLFKMLMSCFNWL